MTGTRSVLLDRLGPDSAQRVVDAFGGTRMHVPGRIANAGRLRLLLGEEITVALVFSFGDSRVSVPLSLDGPGGARTPIDVRKVKKLAQRGWSSARIARELKCSERTVDAKRAALRSRTNGKPRKSDD